jgi:hypothetical protein
MLTLLAAACGGAPRPEPPLDRPAQAEVSRPKPEAAKPEPPPDPRRLPRGAFFADLVAAAARLDEEGKHLSTASCLVREPAEPGEPYRLSADLAVAVRPLPEVPEDLDKRLKEASGRVGVLSRWGQTGQRPFDIALAAFTTTTPASARHPAVVVFVTDAGVYLRQSDAEMDTAARGPMPLDSLGPLLAARAARGPYLLFLTAEANTPVRTVSETLAFLPERNNEVGLAVPLSAGTRLPEPAGIAPDRGLWCARGLPSPAEDAAEGNLPVAALREALLPLSEGAQKCLGAARGAAAAGGKVMLAIRIDEEGRPETVCLVQDEIGDAALGRCLLESARAVDFPAPEPPGFVDVHLPLRLTPAGIERQRAVCR